jgi:uncharacterized membrane protein YqaE (UPF0057 family)
LDSTFRRPSSPTRVALSVGFSSCDFAAIITILKFQHMDSSLHEVWQAAAGSPFVPTVGKGSQFLVAFVLLVLGFSLGGAFALSMYSASPSDPD